MTSLTNSTGSLAQTYTRDSFGNTTNSQGSVSNPLRYTGRDFDSETGLYYYRARYYDSTIGRFISEDPIEFSAGDTNLYAYVRNDSTSLTDPFGLNLGGGKCGKNPCFAQLKCRPTAPGATMTHCFWYVQGSDGKQRIITGGSNNGITSGPNAGYLHVWNVPTQVGNLDLQAPVLFKTPLSPDVCAAVDNMPNFANTFPQDQIRYNWQGPNSNSIANAIENAGGYSPPAPPDSRGWDTPIPKP